MLSKFNKGIENGVELGALQADVFSEVSDVPQNSHGDCDSWSLVRSSVIANPAGHVHGSVLQPKLAGSLQNPEFQRDSSHDYSLDDIPGGLSAQPENKTDSLKMAGKRNTPTYFFSLSMTDEKDASESQRQAEACRTSDPRNRFSTRVDNYIRYRPGYPAEVIELAISNCGLGPDSAVADIGSGTGILSELFLRNGNAVFGVEPNQEMRSAAERLLSGYARFTSVNGAAEATTLPDNAVDFVIAAQAFHWFDQQLARAEFRRILKPNGWVLLIWNERRLATSAFLHDLEELLLKYGTDYAQVRHENVASHDIPSFYSPAHFKLATFENLQELDLEGLKGRVCSASYTPEPGHQLHEAMLKELETIFLSHEVHGKVTIEYDTRVYFGHL